ncbi:hypothetical protein DPMN_108744 [Dreissena polymorpha]|uniref:Uncharacterized protein n=1 Tax=Dreissena polymorpha TaxID=45954 RepID=A0A9D4K9D6_DREPO|nr:hypothetical protein DPMN_108744 [Dreissena polymorpha]
MFHENIIKANPFSAAMSNDIGKDSGSGKHISHHSLVEGLFQAVVRDRGHEYNGMVTLVVLVEGANTLRII